MIFNVLHKIDGGKNVKNHLSNETSFKSLCGRINVESTGGSIDINGYSSAFSEDGIKLSRQELNKGYCDYCIAIACSISSKKTKEEKQSELNSVEKTNIMEPVKCPECLNEVSQEELDTFFGICETCYEDDHSNESE